MGVSGLAEVGEEAIARICEVAPVGICILRADGSVVHANPAFCRIFGVSDSDALRSLGLSGLLAEVVLDSECGEGCGDEVHALDFTRMVEERGWLSQRRDLAWIRLMVCPVSDDSSRSTLYALDVTEERRMLGRLQSSVEEVNTHSAQHQETLDAFEDGVYQYDVSSGKVKFSDGCYRMLGFSSSELPAGVRGWIELIHPRDRDRVVKAVLLHIRRCGPLRGEYRIRKEDGSYLWVELRGRCTEVGPDGRAIRIAGTQTDISERKQLAMQLLQSEKMRVVGQLAGGVAHDFNNQLMGILGYASLLCGELDNSRLLQYAHNIQVAAERSADLTRKLLTFSRQGKLQNSPVDLNDVVNEVVALLTPGLGKQIEFDHRSSVGIAAVEGDATQLQNALLNLALNARDAMPRGGRLLMQTRIVSLDSVAVSKLMREVDPGRFVEVMVRDTGSGITSEDLPHIFEPFFTTKPSGKGAGMGLAAVFGTVVAHGGSLSVRSEVGCGTVVCLYLPAKFNRLAQEREEPHEVRGRGCILLVDDEEMVRDVLGRMLERLGYEVVSAENGAAAVRLYRQNRGGICLTILDMVMPGLTATETFDEIRAFDAEARILLLSGYSREGEARQLIQSGALGFIEKPVSQVELSRRMSRALGAEAGDA